MDAQRNLRCTSFVIRALLATLCVFVIPKLASSEPDAGTQQRDDAGKSSRALGTPGGGAPMHAWSRLFPNSEGCAAAKLDVWLEKGVVTYSIFMSGAGVGGQRAAARIGGGADGTTLLFGEKDCLIRVLIEQAPAGASIDN